MRLLKREIERDQTGSVLLLPEEAEDMWHAYNLIAVGDKLRASTVRRVQSESNTGSVESNRVRVTLTVEIESVQYDVKACTLRINGRNVEENDFVRMGAYHTIDLELNRKFQLSKTEWDIISLERIDMACDVKQSADVAAVLMQEGFACVCLVTSSMTIVRARIEAAVPRKRKGSATQHDKALDRFFESTMQAILHHVDFSIVKCVLIGSPGFVKDQFAEYMFAQAIKQEIKVLSENRSKFLLVHASSGHKHALTELLTDPAVTARLADTKAASEVKALDSFFDMLNKDPDRAFYGYPHVHQADEQNAIETLLVSDELFRSQDLETRRKYVRLVENVKANGGVVRIFSSLHVSGEQLSNLSGIAAILRFPVPEIDHDDAHDDHHEQ
ncbi:translation factor pelota [Capsaspora owczarzaki ATCC 30864]|uniref:Protein pelota homolog n=1 Tax=Capsaspora owczarzaki (strain ATCC 30864) TaxID=595528 RepID=A0A0D2WUB9_CAPO3|nr:translation factor pelota [Capsaspora owczarzaki ATCC 30864]KJE95493.1 translation factor pelota [Capsaspora owczarzaki ATCC 30864]|eukprot:XP_004345532.2 translation factor pelota [Capsaspora owczarzaki ATCC 30864]